MTPHDHRTLVPGCHRCELGRDEAMATLAEERDELEAEVERLRNIIGHLYTVRAADGQALRQAIRTAFGVSRTTPTHWKQLPSKANREGENG